MKETMQKKLLNIIYIGLFAAVITVLAQLSVPTPGGVPMTLQTFGVALCAYVLGWKRGSLSYLVYFLLGLCGVPVFAGFTGGLARLFGPTGGFLLGFFLLSLSCGHSFPWGTDKKKTMAPLPSILLGIVGLLCCHCLGVLHIARLSAVSPTESFLLFSLPYLMKDILSVIAAFFIAKLLRRYLSR